MITSATKKLVRKAETIISALGKSISVAEMSVSRTDMTCATGMVDVQRFHLLAVGKDRDSFTLRDEGLVGMTPGSVSSLTAETHNIHGLKARSFSQIIDIFTPPYDSGRIKDSRWFRVTPSGTKSNEVTATLL